jgi:choline dehydrogenase-like flavoprotein
MDRDLVVVGAGSAGCVIASRVSEDPRQRVLLLEAGPDYRDPEAIPADLLNGLNNSYTAHDWGFVYQRSPLAGPDTPLPRGKVVGGSSAVNTCIALRGDPADYDEWAELAGPEWAWEKCLGAFKRLETDLDIDNDLHGHSGPLPIRRHTDDELVPFQRQSMKAFAALGYSFCPDSNDPSTTGWGPHPMNKVEGRRVSAATAYLTREVRSRTNLDLRPETIVRRLVISRGRVEGVEVETDGMVESIDCRRVVLSAGAIMTPPILVRSGVGPRALLERLGLDTVSDRPGVGARLFDHPGCMVAVATPEPVYADPESVPVIQTTLRYTATGSDDFNDMQIEPFSFVGWQPNGEILGLAIVVERPRSVGRLRIDSADPQAFPIAESNFLADERDVARMLEGTRVALSAFGRPELAPFVRALHWPPPQYLESDERLRDWCRHFSGSGYHPSGTAPMGHEDDESAVCDQYGRVFGVEGLYAADASIMPNIPRANTNIPTIMIGERFGEWLRERQ